MISTLKILRRHNYALVLVFIQHFIRKDFFMTYKKSIPMCYEQAATIANDFLDAFQILYDLEPLRLSTLVQNEKTKVKTFRFLPDRIIFESTIPFCKQEANDNEYASKKKKVSSDDYHLDIIYKLILWNRCFEITLYNDPDDYGYCSMLPDFDSSSYVLCNIVEKRANGDKKYQMTFGFDIEKRTFLELFEVVHYNAVGILREYPNLNCQLETELKDVVIL